MSTGLTGVATYASPAWRMRSAGSGLGVAPGDRLLLRLRDAYLEHWSSFGTPGQLQELSRIALRVGPPARALTWRRILLGVHPAERAEWDPYVAGWMAEYLEPGSRPAPAAAAAGRPGD